MKIPVDEAPAGAALDAAVASKDGIEVKWIGNVPCNARAYYVGTDQNVPVPSFSTDLLAAWLLVTRLAHRGFCNLTIHPNGMVSCYVPSGNILQAADDAPLAICRAFLKAHGVTEVEVPDDA